jgi:hypothetical protein
MSTKQRFYAASVLSFLAGVVLLAISSWPLPQRTVTLAFPSVNSLDFPELQPVTIIGEIEASIPEKMRSGQPGTVNFAFLAGKPANDPAGEQAEDPSYLLEARLEIPGMQVKPGDSILQPVKEGKDLYFSWQIQADRPGINPGTLWTYILVPVSGSQELDRRPVQALQFEIEVAATPFVNPRLMRIVAFACILAAGIFMLRGRFRND